MFRLNALFTVLVVMLLVAPAARADKPSVQNLRHTSGQLARSAVTPEVSELISPPAFVTASLSYEAGTMWVDEGVAAEQAAVVASAAMEPGNASGNAMETGIEEPAQPEPAVPGTPRVSGLEQALASAAAEIRYPTGAARVRHRWHPQIDAIAGLLREHPDARVEVVGHTDVVGDDEHNQWLSTRRAERFRDHLAERGIDAERVDITGVGATQPLDDNETDAGRQRNRRVEVRLVE